jgi:hypothetical protein
MTEASRRNAKFGPENHFYGKKHTAEARAKMSQKLSGEKHPAWNGGAATLPYGPEFTRKYKRLILQASAAGRLK